ncbi:hypothetical protein FY137_18250 [Agrobacterium tumefaciens]|nr:hypothetical protein FY137_18250 [Agrobacterium tumefaciens]
MIDFYSGGGRGLCLHQGINEMGRGEEAVSAEETVTQTEEPKAGGERSLKEHILRVLMLSVFTLPFFWWFAHGVIPRRYSSGFTSIKDDPVSFWVVSIGLAALLSPLCWEAFKSTRAITRSAYRRFNGPQLPRSDEVEKQ